MDISGNSVGIDYHQSELRVCVLNENGEQLADRRCGNSTAEVIDAVSRHGVVKSVAIEACTGSANFADELKSCSDWNVRLCHPGYVRRMRHNPDKSDKKDSYLLADLNRVGYLPQVWLAPSWLRDVKSVVRYREQQVGERRDIKLRIRALLRANRVKVPTKPGLWTRLGMQWLEETLTILPDQTSWVMKCLLRKLAQVEKELSETEKRIQLLLKEDPLTQRLLAERGIGKITSAILRVEIGSFLRFRTGKELSRYCGVTPCNASSGERQADSGLIRAGSPILKCALIETAHTLRRVEPRWKEMALRMKAAGKSGNVIVAAIANRWMRKLFYTMTEFEKGIGVLQEVA